MRRTRPLYCRACGRPMDLKRGGSRFNPYTRQERKGGLYVVCTNGLGHDFYSQGLFGWWWGGAE